MMASLTCVVKPSTDPEEYGTLFGQVCGYGDSICAGITHNATTGTYGAYSMCNSTEQLSFAFSQYVKGQQNNANACNFGGAATTKAAGSQSGACSALISQAGAAGTGTVTSAPSGTGGSGASSTSSKKSAAGAVTVPSFSFGMLQIGACIVGAVITGAGMILL